ncbi:glutathione S-transferase family protein [Phaeobacter sp. 11ANDIMAR09]|uniref:glutathione S-transferase family protein n=1 Tax=Phaeobacter sp. 11ANDIMAR09 TaxID=1225647 RepID=UPI0006C87CA7|nr:glutathione S-transferase family protein [Phaeobacter sp. 11ANDIMAR09]KPD13912.1 glutathione S-transferase [Phaeobacter sp. 11ANDIMAR09]
MEYSVILRGYRYSVYNRIARVVLHEKGVAYKTEEIDPFAANVPEGYLRRHPFGRVPVLSHGEFDVFETSSISQYVNAAFEGPKLMPAEAKAVARVTQVVSIVDSYGYRTMVRQVFAHRVFRPAIGEVADEAEVSAGIDASHTVLGALNNIAKEGRVLDGQSFTVADCHLAPVIAYFVQAREGAGALKAHKRLADWWATVSQRESLQTTEPGLPCN